MYAHFEVWVLVDRFRNLDLFHQGEYAIGCRVYGERTRVAAQPVRYLTGASGAVLSNLSAPAPSQYPGGINDEDNSFRTGSFYIRYREETRMIGEAVVFHVQLPVRLPAQLPAPANAKCRHSCADCNRSGFPCLPNRPPRLSGTDTRTRACAHARARPRVRKHAHVRAGAERLPVRAHHRAVRTALPEALESASTANFSLRSARAPPPPGEPPRATRNRCWLSSV